MRSDIQADGNIHMCLHIKTISWRYKWTVCTATFIIIIMFV